MGKRQDKLFYRAMQFLKGVVRSDVPVKVRSTKLSDDLDGLCTRRKDHFLVQVSSELTVGHAIDVLLHEFAHVEAWGKQNDPHGTAWGKAYSRLYREYLNGFLSE